MTDEDKEPRGISEDLISEMFSELRDSINYGIDVEKISEKQIIELLTKFVTFVNKTLEEMIRDEPGGQHVFIVSQLEAIDEARLIPLLRPLKTKATHWKKNAA